MRTTERVSMVACYAIVFGPLVAIGLLLSLPEPWLQVLVGFFKGIQL